MERNQAPLSRREYQRRPLDHLGESNVADPVDPALVGQTVRTVEIALDRGNFAAAVAAVERARRQHAGESETEGDPLDWPLAAAGIEPRAQNALEKAGLATVRDVLGRTREELRRLPNVAELTVARLAGRLARFLEEHGITCTET